MSSHHEDNDIHDHDHGHGLDFDLPRMMNRRRALGVMATGVGAVALAACGTDGGGSTSTSAGATTTASSAIPEETAGPFPADGSNGPDVLTETGIVREDITTSFAGLEGTAEGVPTTFSLRLLDVAGGGAPLAGAAVYIWHCDRAAAYSLYDAEAVDQNYLRGIQVSDEDGRLSFTSIFPACYAGRWPHAHFEVYESAEAATSGGTKLRTSQLAIPREICDSVYAGAEGYEQSAGNFAQLSLEGDLVFADGFASQLAGYSGSIDEGVALTLNVGV